MLGWLLVTRLGTPHHVCAFQPLKEVMMTTTTMSTTYQFDLRCGCPSPMASGCAKERPIAMRLGNPTNLAVSSGDDLIDQCIQRRGPSLRKTLNWANAPPVPCPCWQGFPRYDREEVASVLFFAFHTSEDYHAAVEVWSGALVILNYIMKRDLSPHGAL